MKSMLKLLLLFVLLIDMVQITNAQPRYPVLSESHAQDEIVNQLPHEFMPVIGVWNWHPGTLEPDGFKSTIDRASMHSPFNLLIPFLRFPDKEVSDDVILNQVKLAAEYAVEKNIALVPDIDVRSARRAFQLQYPDEMQGLLRVKEVELSGAEATETFVRSIDNLSDHYSGGNIPKYTSFGSKLLRVYAYKGNSEGIAPESLQDITDKCTTVFESDDSVRIALPPSTGNQTHAAVLVSFTLFYPDIFAPHLMDFQQALIRQYAGIPLAGICKDEWGFPPYFPRYADEDTHDFWFSEHRAREYTMITGGRDLLSDCLLMAKEFKGKQLERQVAINHFRALSLKRNVDLEADFYNTVKEVFGPDAAVTVHPTWWPYPDENEMKKNGLDWWAVKRDWAQTDEIVPFAARTALCKKWGSPIWYNMYYTRGFSDQVWSSALAGGRLNYLGFQSLYDPELMRAESRIRLLNTISESPLDCPVAVIFGHPGAMNWAGPHFGDVGMDLVNLFWNTGYPADLIPSSEIANGSLYMDEEGWVCYGKQRYSALVLYHPEFDKKATSEFFMNAGKSQTSLFRMGDWTRDFYGEAIDDEIMLPVGMKEEKDYRNVYLEIMDVMRDLGIPAQTPATENLDEVYYTLRDFNQVSKFPPTSGYCRLIDGTIIHVAGTNNVSGDTIDVTHEINGYPVVFDAVGVAAVRLDDKGEVQALAAGGLKSFKSKHFEINLDERTDLSLWVDDKGAWRGIIQGGPDQVPAELMEITENWDRLGLPELPGNIPE